LIERQSSLPSPIGNNLVSGSSIPSIRTIGSSEVYDVPRELIVRGSAAGANGAFYAITEGERVESGNFR